MRLFEFSGGKIVDGIPVAKRVINLFNGTQVTRTGIHVRSPGKTRFLALAVKRPPEVVNGRVYVAEFEPWTPDQEGNQPVRYTILAAGPDDPHRLKPHLLAFAMSEPGEDIAHQGARAFELESELPEVPEGPAPSRLFLLQPGSKSSFILSSKDRPNVAWDVEHNADGLLTCAPYGSRATAA